MDDRPELYPELQPIWRAFMDLNRQRSAGYTANPISITDIASWLDLHAIDDHEIRLSYYRLISAADNEFLNYHNQKNE